MSKLYPAVVALRLRRRVDGGCGLQPCFGANGDGPDAPPLDIPAPPPRVVETADAEAPSPGARSSDAPTPAPRRRAARPPRSRSRRRSRNRRSRNRRPHRAAETPPPSEPRQAASPRCRRRRRSGRLTLEQEIRDQLAARHRDLNRVDYQALNADAKTQYDQAKRFMRRRRKKRCAAKNLVFAQNLADKAATLAAQLAGR